MYVLKNACQLLTCLILWAFTILYNKLSFGIKLFLRIEELTSYEVIKPGIFFTISMTTVTDGYFVAHDNSLYHLNWMHVRCKMALISS